MFYANAVLNNMTTPPNTQSIDNNTHPLYLHNNDQPGMILISKKLLGSENYASWKRSLRIALSAKNKLVIVTGAFPAPPEDSPLFVHWQRVNDMVITWILNTVSDDISNSMTYMDSAFNVWNELNDRFSAVTGHKFYETQRDLFKLEQENDSIELYYHKLKGLWDELQALETNVPCTCGASQDWALKSEKKKLIQFLMGLHSSYTAARGQLLMMTPMPTVNQAYMLLKQEEKQRQTNSSNNPSPLALMVNVPKQSSTSGSYTQNRFSDRPSPPVQECSHCHIKGHTKEKCYKLVGYPPEHPHHPNNRGKKKFTRPASNSSVAIPQTSTESGAFTQNLSTKVDELQTQIKSLMQCFNNNSPSTPATDSTPFSLATHIAGTTFSMASSMHISPHTWVIDTGATNHMCCNLSVMQDVKILHIPLQVKFPNGQTVKVTHVGSVFIHPLSILLSNVLHIPVFNFNLLSVSSLATQTHSTVCFTSTDCYLQDQYQKKGLVLGNIVGGLYQLSNLPHMSSAFSATQSSVFSLWHRRLGHVPSKVLSRISALHVACTVDTLSCGTCPLAKQCKQPFPLSQSQATSPFDLVHCDLWGPYRVPTYNGCKYFLTLVDDYSRAVWTILLPTKQHASQSIKDFFAYVHNQFTTTIKCLRSDNGGEFLSKDLTDFFTSHGVLHQTTCPYTPQQNGRVERKHRNLLEMSRALMFQANLPLVFWGECILTSAYLINRIPTSVLGFISPYEKLFNKAPSYSHLKVFGCLAHMSVHPHDKLSPRALKTVFLGYSMTQKGYRLFDPVTKQFHVSRHVVFNEDSFPYITNKTTLPTLVFPPPANNADDDDPVDTSASHISHHPMDTISPPTSPIATPTTQSTTPDTNPSGSPPTTDSIPPPPRVSLRHKIQPLWMKDYVTTTLSCQANAILTDCPIDSTKYNFSHYSPPSNIFACAVSPETAVREPYNFTQAVTDSRWVDAMDKELTALQENNTWEIVSPPPGKKVVECKWVYKVKYNADGSIDKFKARLVAKGYTQIAGQDYHNTFSPVAKMATVRTLLALATVKGWDIHQLDVNNAFLHGELSEEVYMKIPKGHPLYNSGSVCKLLKSIYGLKQASRVWFEKLASVLISLGFEQTVADYSLFIYNKGDVFVTALVYVDDILLTGTSSDFISQVKASLHSTFTIKDLGLAKYYLGLEIHRTEAGLYLHQHKFVHDLLLEAGLENAKPLSLPVDAAIKLSPTDGVLLDDPKLYRKFVGKLLYLTVSRPDIAFAVHHLSQFLQSPRVPHMIAVQRILRYLKSTPFQGLFYSADSSLTLSAYCDSDWGSTLDSNGMLKSITGMCLLLGSSLIIWHSSKQKVVSRSTAEAELRAIADTTCELSWVNLLLSELLIPQSLPIPIHSDNQAALDIAADPVFHPKTKHFALDCHFVREQVQSQLVRPVYLPSTRQLADIFTKGLGRQAHWRLLSSLNVRQPHSI